MKKFLCAFLLVFALLSGAATLVWHDQQEVRIATNLKVKRISQGEVEVEYRDRTRAIIPAAAVERYYDRDLKVPGSGVINTKNNYEVGPIRFQIRNNSAVTSNDKASEPVITLNFPVMAGQAAEQVPEPYVFIMVLLSPTEPNGQMTKAFYAVPGNSRARSRSWDESAIYEQVIAPDRPLKKLSDITNNNIELKLTGQKDRQVLACHIEIWNGHAMARSYNWSLNPQQELSAQWYLEP